MVLTQTKQYPSNSAPLILDILIFSYLDTRALLEMGVNDTSQEWKPNKTMQNNKVGLLLMNFVSTDNKDGWESIQPASPTNGF